METRKRSALFPTDALWDKSWHPGLGESTIRKRTNCLQPELIFYTSFFCPFAQRTWIVLEECKVKYKWREINPYEVDEREPGGYTKKALPLDVKRELYPEFIEASPRGLVPAIRHGNKVLWESLVTAEYIDTVFGDGSLVPNDPYERAQVQIWCEHCTNRIQKAYYKALMAQNATDRATHLNDLFDECRSLAKAMSSDGPFFMGTRFTMVDVALAPFWQRMIWVGSHYIQLELPDDEHFHRLNGWWRACASRPSVSSTFVSKPRLIATYSDYAKNVGTSDFAQNLN